MLNRSVVVVGHEPAFIGWLKTTGVSPDRIAELERSRDRTAYLIPACRHPEELDEVVEEIFQELFRRELEAWQAVRADWPDTADFELFTRWFTVDAIPTVIDAGRGRLAEASALAGEAWTGEA